ncbi:hypothetical protein PSM7751_00714 [Pseudooceanicola marinus]|uniref:Uncharacterized protein n=1 Tax=Pseudooceanicola marinus TaxID=396013 RepID=A0A1X6YGC0_9RHOB|nr:hypothetical protein PSM7751_00714 [Pseudooceanicola marinus]
MLASIGGGITPGKRNLLKGPDRIHPSSAAASSLRWKSLTVPGPTGSPSSARSSHVRTMASHKTTPLSPRPPWALPSRKQSRAAGRRPASFQSACVRPRTSLPSVRSKASARPRRARPWRPGRESWATRWMTSLQTVPDAAASCPPSTDTLATAAGDPAVQRAELQLAESLEVGQVDGGLHHPRQTLHVMGQRAHRGLAMGEVDQFEPHGLALVGAVPAHVRRHPAPVLPLDEGMGVEAQIRVEWILGDRLQIHGRMDGEPRGGQAPPWPSPNFGSPATASGA